MLTGLAALIVFVAGPLACALHDDGDGSPDIPVVVSDSDLFSDLSANSGVHRVSADVCSVKGSDHLGIATRYKRVVEHQFSTVISAFDVGCPLRC